MSFFSRRIVPQVAVALAQPVVTKAPLETIAVLDVPDEPVIGDGLLPCERSLSYAGRSLDLHLDYEFFDAIAKATGSPARYINPESTRKAQTGWLDMPYPLFAYIDPFYDHGRGGPAATALRAIQAAKDSPVAWPACVSAAMRECDGTGILLGGLTYEGGGGHMRYTTELGGDFFSERTDGLYERRGNFFAMYCTVPGFVPPSARTAIMRAADIAKATGGKLRLLLEAKWVLASVHPVPSAKADPLIVIVKGTSIAYIDRFDCTAAEEHLAREHTVRVPGP